MQIVLEAHALHPSIISLQVTFLRCTITHKICSITRFPIILTITKISACHYLVEWAHHLEEERITRTEDKSRYMYICIKCVYIMVFV